MERIKRIGFMFTILLCAVLVAALAPRPNGKTVFSGAQPAGEAEIFSPSRKIILDAGHGGFDGGASSEDGILEKEINLKIAQKLEQYLIFGGYEVIMTRKEDRGLEDSLSASIPSKKRSDILNRMELADKNPEGIFVSIHLNFFPQTKYRGSQVFYAPNGDESRRLASVIRETLRLAVDPQNEREIKKGYDTIYLLKHAKNTAVLVECGFLSNKEESRLLLEEEYQNKLAFAIFAAIERYNAGYLSPGGTS